MEKELYIDQGYEEELPINLPPLPPPLSSLPFAGVKACFVLGLLFALFADFLFWKQPVGWNVSLFGVCLSLILIIALNNSPQNNWLRMAGPASVISAAILVNLLHSSYLGLILGIGGVVGFIIAAQYERFLSLIGWLIEIVKFWFYTLIISIWDICIHLKTDNLHFDGLMKTLKTWLIAAGLTSGFFLLFSMANPVLSGWMDAFCSFVSRIDLNIDFISLLRVGHTLLFFLFVWSLLYYRSTKSDEDWDVDEPPTFPVKLTDACLILFNTVFALQTFLDIGYLFKGMKLPAEFTYAEYAHRGFYPLWVASMLAGGFMLLFWSDNQEKYPPSKMRNTLLFAWIAQNGFLLYSAIYRMYLYVCAYSLTRLRITAVTGMILVAVGLFGITIRILRRKSIGWLLNMNGVAVLVVVSFLALINIPARVAWFNVRHCKESSGEGVPLDADYLYLLGIDALPALINFEGSHPDSEIIAKVRGVIRCLKNNFEADADNWRAWNLSRYQIARLIEQNPDIQGYDSDRNPVFDRSRYAGIKQNNENRLKYTEKKER